MSRCFTLFAWSTAPVAQALPFGAEIAAWSAPGTTGEIELLALEPTAAPLGGESTHDLYGALARPPTMVARIPVRYAVDLPSPPAGVVAWCLADSVTHTGDTRAGPAGRLGLTRRHDGTDVDDFAAAWRQRHVPLVLRSGPRFETYTTHVVRVGAVAWSGIAEQTFASREAAAAHDHNNRAVVPEVAADARTIVARAEQYWYRLVGEARGNIVG